jgi:hypothetical protein
MFRRVVFIALLLLIFASSAAAQIETIAKARAKYPTPLGSTHGAFLIEVACATGKGLLRKDWGTFVRLPDGTGIAQDILMERDGRHYDILGDGEASATPDWRLVTDPPSVDPSRYYAPACAPQPDQPPATPTNDLLARLTALEQEVSALRVELAMKPAWTEDRFKASVSEVFSDLLLPNLRVCGRTDTRGTQWLAHSHAVCLPLEWVR